jgi:hypothetical protein
MRLLRDLPDSDAFELHLLRITMCDGSRLRERALELFDSGVPIVYVRVGLDDYVRELDGGAA